jgi:hypothetical protein
VAAGGTDAQPCIHIDANHVATRREPQLTLAREQHVPRLVLLPVDQGMLAVGAEPPVGSGLASGAGQAVVAAGPAVLGPSARMKVPAAESPDSFFAAFGNTWRSEHAPIDQSGQAHQRVAPIDRLAEPDTKEVVGLLQIGLAGPHRIRRISTTGGWLPAIYNIWRRRGITKFQQLAAFFRPDQLEIHR